MTLIDRYLHAVRSFLPASRQDDIIRELSDDIYSQAADREEALGRPLTDAETGALLRQFGHPMLLAAKYRPQRQLIGPPLFPFYWFALKTALGAALIVHGAIALAMVVGGQPADRIIGPLAAFPFGPAVTVFGWVTLAFAGIQMVMPHLRGIDAWNPDRLPIPGTEAVPSRLGLVRNRYRRAAALKALGPRSHRPDHLCPCSSAWRPTRSIDARTPPPDTKTE